MLKWLLRSGDDSRSGGIHLEVGRYICSSAAQYTLKQVTAAQARNDKSARLNTLLADKPDIPKANNVLLKMFVSYPLLREISTKTS